MADPSGGNSFGQMKISTRFASDEALTISDRIGIGTDISGFVFGLLTCIQFSFWAYVGCAHTT